MEGFKRTRKGNRIGVGTQENASCVKCKRKNVRRPGKKEKKGRSKRAEKVSNTETKEKRRRGEGMR